MSHRLGKVHHWLYNQIKLAEDRELELIKDFKEKYNSNELETIIEQVRSDYGALKGDESLKSLIGDSQIHPWLEETIIATQKREAGLVKLLMEKYDDKQLLLEVYKIHGEQVAEEVSGGENNLQSTFELLKNNFLKRMPCDRLSGVVSEEKDRIVWRHEQKLHTEFWQQVDVDVELMHQLYSNWIEGFLTAINPELNYQRDIKDGFYEDVLTT
ncbi:MAG: hypothetical protein ACQEP9_04550 [Bacillota bacterium]